MPKREDFELQNEFKIDPKIRPENLSIFNKCWMPKMNKIDSKSTPKTIPKKLFKKIVLGRNFDP